VLTKTTSIKYSFLHLNNINLLTG